MSEMRQWRDDATNNTMAVPHGAPEGWFGAQVNDWGRESMAVLRRWFDSPEWFDYFYTLSPSMQYTLTRVSDTELYLLDGKNAVSLVYPNSTPGQRLRITDGGGNTHILTVVSATYNAGATRTEITTTGDAVPSNPVGMEMHVAPSMLGFAWGGYGDDAARDARYAVGPPENAVWYNSEVGKGYVELGVAGSWVPFPAGPFGGQPTDAFVQTENSTLPEGQAGQVQTVANRLDVEEGLRAGTPAPAELLGEVGSGDDVNTANPGTDAAGLHAYNNDPTPVKQASMWLRADGGIDVDTALGDTPSTRVPLLGKYIDVAQTFGSTAPGTWLTLVGDFTLPGAPSAGDKFLVEVLLNVSASTGLPDFVSNIDTTVVSLGGIVLGIELRGTTPTNGDTPPSGALWPNAADVTKGASIRVAVVCESDGSTQAAVIELRANEDMGSSGVIDVFDGSYVSITPLR